MTTIEYFEDQDELPRNEKLQEIRAGRQGSAETTCSPSTASSPDDGQEDPGLSVLVDLPYLRVQTQPSVARPNGSLSPSADTVMADQQDDPPPIGAVKAVGSPTGGILAQDRSPKKSTDSAVDFTLHAENNVENGLNVVNADKASLIRSRADSTQGDARAVTEEAQSIRAGLNSPLKIKTNSNAELPPSHQKRDSISASPTLSKHVMPSADVNGQNLAPFEPASPSTSSPKAERLPSIHQLTNSLTELAEAATLEIPRHQQGISHHHRQSFGSAMSQSPILSSHTYPASSQTSPQAYYPASIMARSPTSTIGDSHYASPPAYTPYGGYTHRRPSMVEGVPPIMPKLPTGSSSSDSYSGYPSSGTEGYSTNHTTPIDIGQTVEYAHRPMLPPPAGMHGIQPLPATTMAPGPYKCDVPNCTAGTFQTQYLLKYANQPSSKQSRMIPNKLFPSSHKNVHSQSRPHYCPVPGCSRSEGGKGFKRKNEMIRHGLVHNSPGYVCPFCPEREHRYPRPDNLQRYALLQGES